MKHLITHKPKIGYLVTNKSNGISEEPVLELNFSLLDEQMLITVKRWVVFDNECRVWLDRPDYEAMVDKNQRSGGKCGVVLHAEGIAYENFGGLCFSCASPEWVSFKYIMMYL